MTEEIYLLLSNLVLGGRGGQGYGGLVKGAQSGLWI